MLYKPREDSFLLKEQVKKFTEKGMKVLDMGTGTGIQAETALANGADVLAVDSDKESIKFVSAKGIKCIKSDLFDEVNGQFDLIIFNPPYLPEEEGEEGQLKKQVSGGKKGSEIIEGFLESAKDYLKPNGKILLIYSSLTPDVPGLIKKYGFEYKGLSEKKLFFEKIYCALLK